MLLLDSPAQARWAGSGAQERLQAQQLGALEREIQSHTVSVREDAGRDTGSLLAQMGRPLASGEMQRRLHLCNPRLLFERSPRYPELTGVYIEREERNAAGGWTKRKVHICGMESGIMPEFSVLHQTTQRVPNPAVVAGGGREVSREAVEWLEVPTFAGETRGWRTVLVRLLKAGLLTRGDVEKHFDWVPSQDSQRWAEHTT